MTCQFDYSTDGTITLQPPAAEKLKNAVILEQCSIKYDKCTDTIGMSLMLAKQFQLVGVKYMSATLSLVDKCKNQ